MDLNLVCAVIGKFTILNIYLTLENMLFNETNCIVALLLLAFLHFIMLYVILANHINFQMLKIETIIFVEF